ncbi:hypothetical protein ACFX2I_030902 [Malus domestica]
MVKIMRSIYLLQYAFYEARHMKHWKTVYRSDSGIKLLSKLIPYVMRLWNVLLRITCLHATKAKTTCPSDPLVYNELGVVAYHLKEYTEAVWWFEKTLAQIPSPFGEMWEPTMVNLAHAYRKLKIYDEAIKFYEKALALSTRSVSTYAVLAYAYHLQDNLNAAITYYQKALWLKPDDQFCTEMLSVALVDDSRRGVDSGTEFLRLSTCLVLRCFYKKWV